MAFKEMIGLTQNKEFQEIANKLDFDKPFGIGDVSLNELDKIALYKVLGDILQFHYDKNQIRKRNVISVFITSWIGTTRSLDHFGSAQLVDVTRTMINKQNETTLQLNNPYTAPNAPR